MSIIPSWRLILLALVLGVVGGGSFSWWITSTNYDADVATLSSENAIALKSVSDQATADSEAARIREHSFQQQIAALDADLTKERENAKRESDQLLADVAAGLRRVQFASAALATCEQSAGTVRSASSLGDATAVQLSATAGRNILGIRVGINEDQEKIAYLQEYIRALQVLGVIAK